LLTIIVVLLIHSDVALVEICSINFLWLHMLTINRVITLPTVSSGYSELYCRSGARIVASRKSGGAERSSERELQKNDGAERSERSRSGNGAGSRSYRNRLERGAGFSLQYSVLCLRCCIFDVWHVGSLWVHKSSRICCGALSASVQ